MPIRTMILLAVSLGFLYLLFTAGAPFLIALVAAIFLEPLTQLLMTKARLPRVVAATITSSLFTVVLFGALWLLGMKLIRELGNFFSNLPRYLESASGYITDWIDRFQTYSNSGVTPLPEQMDEWVSNLLGALTQLSTKISSVLLGFAAGIPNFFIFFIVTMVAIFLFNISMPAIKQSFLSLFEDKSRDQVEQVLVSLRKSVFGFLRAQVILSVVTYILSFVGLLLIGTNYPMAIALLIVIVDILPILGTGSVLVPWAAYNVIVGDFYTAVGLVLLFLVITVIRRIIEPKVLGDAVGIGALPALISLYLGYELVGVIGVFLGPIVVIVFMAMRKAGLFEFKIKF